MKNHWWIPLIVTLALTLSCSASFQIPNLPDPSALVATPLAVVEKALEPTATPGAAATPLSGGGKANPAPIPTLPAVPRTTNGALRGVAIASDEQLVKLYEQVSPGVVSLLVVTNQGGGEGSGFVLDKKGHIVTNFHVVDGASDIEVHFLSGLKVRGKVVGTDTDSDLAVVKVSAPENALNPLPLADSDQLKVGQAVVAIGNPFGLAGTMTLGIVSAKGRTLGSLRQAPGGSLFSSGAIIQTDASINPGNSGGPLLNLRGEVVGVNRAIRTTSTTAMGDPLNTGIGFAVASNIVRRVAPVLIEKGKYDYPYLGVTSRDSMPLAVLEALGIQRMTGAYVIEVTPGSPADKAGLVGGTRSTSIAGLKAGGDLIIAIDGQPVQVFGDLLGYLMTNKSPGDTVKLLIVRDNKEKEVMVTLGKRP